ncbi:MAG: hypothetical protein K0B52_06095 [FCB group bacterium]|nr:hypothetical protein [FCB group bacterium]
MIGPRIFPNNPEYGYFYYVNPGIALHFSYPIAKNLRAGIRLGTEIMIGYDMGSWHFHPQPQPNAALTLTF